VNLTPLGIEGAWLAETPVWSDDRGYFLEWFKSGEVLAKTGFDFSVKQANISLSNKGVIRGIHYSLAVGGQAKWVSCLSGSIVDVVVDIRPGSPTYKKVEYFDMKAGDGKALLIGPGLGHGFIALEDKTVISYLLTSPYSPELEFGVSPTDAELNIDWHLKSLDGMNPVLSAKDREAPTLEARTQEGKLP
jgi:dTDP-4-dehydrorhamnose 3,5-epimerase